MTSAMREQLRIVHAILLLLWPLAGVAAGESLGATLGAVTFADWASLILLANFSGLVALLNRIRKSLEAEAASARGDPFLEEDRQRIDWRVFAIAHMTGAMFVGVVAFFACESLDMNNYLEAATIALLSWSGAKIADKWANTFGEVVVARAAGMLGKQTEKP